MRPIDADALLNEANADGAYGYVDAWQIANAPTLEVKPMKYGHVIESIENGRMKRIFSCCGEDFTKLTVWMRPNYCPNCGARMDLEVDE